MSEPGLVAVEVPLVGDERLKNWAKVVESVDDSRSTGFAFGGYFVATGGIQDLPTGAVLIVYGEKGSRANPRSDVKVYTVNGDGTLSHEHSASGRAWARSIRDRVADLVDSGSLGAEPWPVERPDLRGYPTAELIAELERRGTRVQP